MISWLQEGGHEWFQQWSTRTTLLPCSDVAVELPCAHVGQLAVASLRCRFCFPLLERWSEDHFDAIFKLVVETVSHHHVKIRPNNHWYRRLKVPFLFFCIDMNLAVRLARKQKYNNERTRRRVAEVVRQMSYCAHFDCGRAQHYVPVGDTGTAKTGGTKFKLTITLDHALQTTISCVGYSVAMQVVTSRSSSASTA